MNLGIVSKKSRINERFAESGSRKVWLGTGAVQRISFVLTENIGRLPCKLWVPGSEEIQ